MIEKKKQAYRRLLYMAMLDIRPLQWTGRGWQQRLNLFSWWSSSKRVLTVGYIAEWLHNLALFSSLDFNHFDEDRFWADYQWLLGQQPNEGLEKYRTEFERCLADDS